jgi:hypothetical protein
LAVVTSTGFHADHLGSTSYITAKNGSISQHVEYIAFGEILFEEHSSYIKVKGVWCYLYRAVDKLGNTVDFLLTRKRQRMSAQSFLIKAISNNCRPKVINIDKSDSNIAAIKVYNKRSFSKIKIRQLNISTIW